MKKNLLIIFLCISVKAHSAGKASFEAPLNTRAESMGETGMIFGKEHGALYFSPTSILSSKKSVTGGLATNWYLFDDINNKKLSIKGNWAAYLKISNFVLGPGIESDLSAVNKAGRVGAGIYIPVACGFEIGDFSIGIGAKCIAVARKFANEGIEVESSFYGFTSDLGGSYKTFIGHFAVAINNIISLGTSSIDESMTLMRNLKLGYGKEFEIGSTIDSIKTTVELDNLLMEDIYLNTNGQGDYAWFRKLRLGSELSASLEEIIYLDGRIGLKNFFPTLGFTISIGRIFTFDYAFTNQDFGKEWGKNRILLNSFSLSIGYF